MTWHSKAEQSDGLLELANQPGFTERFSGNTQVSGQFLSGLAYASGLTKLDLKEFRLLYSRPLDSSPEFVCVRVTSDDGRYWASNLYRAKAKFEKSAIVPLPTAYDEQLGSYDVDGLLVLATFSESCDQTSGNVYVPGILGSKANGAKLIAYVNVSQSKVSANLLDFHGKEIEKVSCRKPQGGGKVTFSHTCDISIEENLETGKYKLVIGVRGLTGQVSEQEYAVHIE